MLTMEEKAAILKRANRLAGIIPPGEWGSITTGEVAADVRLLLEEVARLERENAHCIKVKPADDSPLAKAVADYVRGAMAQAMAHSGRPIAMPDLEPTIERELMARVRRAEEVSKIARRVARKRLKKLKAAEENYEAMDKRNWELIAAAKKGAILVQGDNDNPVRIEGGQVGFLFMGKGTVKIESGATVGAVILGTGSLYVEQPPTPYTLGAITGWEQPPKSTPMIDMRVLTQRLRESPGFFGDGTIPEVKSLADLHEYGAKKQPVAAPTPPTPASEPEPRPVKFREWL